MEKFRVDGEAYRAAYRASLQDMATEAGRGYARAGWDNADVAAAAWLRAGLLATANNPVAAEQAFVRGFRAARAGR